MPILTWYLTWFGRPLSDSQIESYLDDKEKPRHAQHALAQIADRIMHGDQSVKRWYPRVVGLAAHPLPEVRQTAAWVMGQDNSSEEFHRALLELLHDPVLMVRWNAALGLVRFGDANGRNEILLMLKPYTVIAPTEGIVSESVALGNPVKNQTPLLSISRSVGQVVKVQSPLPGHVEKLFVTNGARVTSGTDLVRIMPANQQVYEALRALYLIGQREDLPDVEHYVQSAPDGSSQVRQQAMLTAQAIRSRAGGR
jgi:acetyl/propionyl-CoA carboxylase alpha subunit